MACSCNPTFRNPPAPLSNPPCSPLASISAKASYLGLFTGNDSGQGVKTAHNGLQLLKSLSLKTTWQQVHLHSSRTKPTHETRLKCFL
jgi:hypothetical protein